MGLPAVSFTLDLAGVRVGVEALFETSRVFCEDYLWDQDVDGFAGAPDVRVSIEPADIEAERINAARQDRRECRDPRAWSDAYLETLALYRKAAAALLPYDVVVFHGTVLAVDGRAYVFTAPSGTGKTTHARFWLSQVPGAYVLNGDKPLLRLGAEAANAESVLAYGTPWQGKEGMGVRGSLPLAGICLLERGETDSIERIDGREALPMLIQQTHCPDAADALVRVVSLAGRVSQLVPLWRMKATLNEGSALVSYAAMSGAAG